MSATASGEPPLPALATVRRFEAAGFRAWPAASVHYDGTWVVRVTPSHPAKRLNSINPLDPGDTRDIAERIDRAGKRFEAAGRPVIFRLSPLSGMDLSRHLDSQGWERFDESLVMRLALEESVVHDAMDQIPMKDMNRFIGASLETHGIAPGLRIGLADVIGSIPAEAGLFVLEGDETPIATAICVHDGDLAGLFEIATCARERGQGYGRRIVLSALKWARLRGARQAWLQVGAENTAARRLYESIGFEEIYRYHYRRLPGA